MRTLGATPLFRTSKSPLFAFGLLIVVIFAAYKSAEAILADDIMSLAFAAVLFIGGAVFIAILNDWRRGLYFLIAWILFEDMVRKYLGNNMAIYFAKDFLALALYLSFFVPDWPSESRNFRFLSDCHWPFSFGSVCFKSSIRPPPASITAFSV